MPPVIVPVADIAPVPWRNGGGVTRELLAWPEPKDWLLRVSVAEIHQSGDFSAYPGIDRWFAVLQGGGVQLATAGTGPTELTASQPALHAFSGDAATHCTALGAPTLDFNLMTRRSRVRLLQRPVRQCPRLASRAEGVGLFIVQTTELRQHDAPALELPNMSLAWWPNPGRVPLVLQLASTGLRGWWFEVDTRPGPPN